MWIKRLSLEKSRSNPRSIGIQQLTVARLVTAPDQTKHVVLRHDYRSPPRIASTNDFGVCLLRYTHVRFLVEISNCSLINFMVHITKLMIIHSCPIIMLVRLAAPEYNFISIEKLNPVNRPITR